MKIAFERRVNNPKMGGGCNKSYYMPFIRIVINIVN